MGRKLRNHALPEDGTELREESHNRQRVVVGVGIILSSNHQGKTAAQRS